MSDPARWRSPEGGGPSEARDLLRHAAAPKAFDAAARARNAAAIAKISAGAVSAPTTFVGAKLLAKVGLAGLLAVTAGAGVQRARAHHAPHAPVAHVVAAPSSARPVAHPPVADRAAHIADRASAPSAPVVESHAPVIAQPVAPAPVAPSPVAPVAVAPVAVAHAPIAPSHPVVREHPTQPAAPSETVATPPSTAGAITSSGVVSPHVVPTAAAPEEPLVREASMLGAAVASIDSDPAAALANLDHHAREFPSGQMAAERDFLAVRALLNLHREADARARGEALSSRSPASPYSARVRRLFSSK